MSFVMAGQWQAPKSDRKAPLGFQSHPPRLLRHSPHELCHIPVELWDPQMATLSGHRLETPRRLGNLHCSWVCIQQPQTEPYPQLPPATWSCMEATLSFTETNSNTLALSPGLVSLPIPAWRLSPGITPEKIQPLFSSLALEPEQCVEEGPTII